MLPDPRGFARALHRELAVKRSQTQEIQTAGGLRASVDFAAAYLILNLGDGLPIVDSYERAAAKILKRLVVTAQKLGADSAQLAAARAAIPATTRLAGGAARQLYQRARDMASAVESFACFVRTAPELRASRAVSQMLEQLAQAEERFRIDWGSATNSLLAEFAGLSSDENELSVEQLQAYIASLGPERGSRVENLRMLPGAHSREVYFLDVVDGAGVRQSLVLRRDREQNATPASVAEERPIMVTLRQRGFPVPEVLGASSDKAILGRPFLLMRRVDGGELAAQADPRACLPAAAQLLAQLHRTPVDGLSFPLRLLTAPLEYAWDRLIETTHETWLRFKPSAAIVMERAYSWLRDNTSRVSTLNTYVHGDFQPQNILVNGHEVAALIDFEVCHLGHPAEDLWAIRARIDNPAWNEFFDSYLSAGGPQISSAELDFCAVWVPFYYSTIAATAYDTFALHSGFELATGAPTLIQLPQLLQFLSQALRAAGG